MPSILPLGFPPSTDSDSEYNPVLMILLGILAKVRIDTIPDVPKTACIEDGMG